MPTLREIRGHIASVRTTAKITRALEMVSTARYQRLSNRVLSTRTFAEKSWEVLNHLAATAQDQVRENPLFCGRPTIMRTGMLLITSDRGMVGAYNQNVIALATQYLEQHHRAAQLVTIGKMGRNEMLRLGIPIHADFSLTDRDNITALTPVARVLLDGFSEQLFDEVVVAYTQFQSQARLQPAIRQILPVCPAGSDTRREYLYEPEPEDLLLALLPRLVRFQIYQAFLESQAAENASRVAAMHSATQNAQRLIDDLSLVYNKARQESITSELVDILGGATALSEQREQQI